MTRNNFSRRGLLRASAGVLAAPYVIPALAADTLVVNGYGAEFQDIILRTTVEPFEKKFGVRITYDNAGMAAQTYAKIRAGRGAAGIDVAGELTPAEVILGQKEKLLEPITEAEVPNLKYVWAKSRTIVPSTGVVYGYQYLSLLWNKSQLEKPESWANYWMPGAAYGDKIKGHLVAFEPANLLSVYALIMAAKLKGGGVDNMQPAWDLLQAQKPWIGLSLLASDAAAPYFENDQVWLAPFWSARAGYYVAKNYPVAFTIPKEGTIGLANCCCVPVGASNKKLAYEFINFRLEPEIQRAFHLAYRTSPGRPDLGEWPPEYAATQIVTEEKLASVEFPDSALIGSKRSEWTRKWQEIMAG